MGWWQKIFARDVSPAQRQAGFDDDLSVRLRHTASGLSAAATRQADAVHETMASITEIRAMLAQSDQQVNRSLLLAEETRQAGQERLRTIDRLQKAMDGIRDSNHLLNDLQEAFQTIHSKTRAINEIVSKTKLLSFNASIEAARAGQFGKGFSVVAEEVGRLAQSSGQAAKEIEQLVMESQIRATSVVEMVIARGNEGVTVTRDVKQTYSEMAAAIGEISIALSQIAQASREQNIGVERTTAAIEKIGQAMHTNKATAEEIVRLTKPVPPADDVGASVEKFNEAPGSRNASVLPIDKVTADDPSFKAQD